MALLDEAIKYATKYHWAVFPVHPRSKRPLTPNGCKDAKKDVGAINAWWTRYPDASIGIATGSASNLIVIDEDIDFDKGLDGVMTMSKWERDNGAFPETTTAITGRGGYHLYFHYTGTDIGNRAGILEGVDVRGEGGYVIAPPSIHPNGMEYAWEYEPDDYPPAEITDTVKAFLSIGRTQHKTERFKLPEQIAPGQRNATLYRLACSLQAQGIPDDGIMAAVQSANAERCEDPLEDDEVEQILNSALRKPKGEMAIFNDNKLPKQRPPQLTMTLTKDGEVTDRPAQTIRNAEEAITFDEALYGRIRWNEIARAPYVTGPLPWKMDVKGWREWTNTDDSNLRSYIEAKYGLKSAEKIMDALTNVASAYSFNPIISTLEDCRSFWDGNEHIKHLLPDMLGADESEYTETVMKVFMYGAIERVRHPGCKFDYMPVLVGEQGCGKSSFLRVLALKSEWFNDNFSTFDTARAIENMRGMWIVEVGELQAMKRAKDVEQIKSFITSQVDVYRQPYGRRTEQLKRMCVFAGTTNSQSFLTDATGNRRFLPITCHIDRRKYSIQDEPERALFEMMQAWGEAYDTVMRGKHKLVLPKKIAAVALKMQERYVEEDTRVGVIKEWLSTYTGDRVCVRQLFEEALKCEGIQMTRRDSNDLHTIMKTVVTNWEEKGIQRCGRYGPQRTYVRKAGYEIVDSDDGIPF